MPDHSRSTKIKSRTLGVRTPSEPQEDLGLLEKYIEDLWKFLPLPICYVNPLHKILDVNKALLDLTGYSETELMGMNISNVFAESKRTQVRGERILQEMQLEEETTVIKKDKERIPVRIYAQCRKDEDGDSIGYFLASIDISQEKEFFEGLSTKVKERTKELENMRTALMNMLEDTEEARRNAEEDQISLNLIIKTFQDGLLVFNSEGRIEMVNPQAEKYLGLNSELLQGKPLSFLAQEPSIKELGAYLQDIFSSKKYKEKEITLKPHVIEVVPVPLERSNEEHKGMLVMMHNVTREKQIERLKTEFVSLAAHQLRTPLSAIKWTIRMMIDGEAGKLSEQQRALLEKTYSSNERMIGLINDLLNVTRIEEGRYLYRPTFSHIEDTIALVVESYKEKAQRSKISLEFKRPSKKSPQVLIDSQKIELVVQNLIDNALRYTPAGGKVTVSMKSNEDKVEVMVKDTGMGIPENQKRRVFQKFFRATNAKRIDTEGSGLGLYLIKNIIGAHKGEVWFESEENKGTTFHFSLPVKKEMEEFLKKF